MEDIERIGIILALLIIIDNFISFYLMNNKLKNIEATIVGLYRKINNTNDLIEKSMSKLTEDLKKAGIIRSGGYID